MAKINVAFIGYRDDWEIERLRSGAPPDVEVAGLPMDSPEDEGRKLAANADMIIPWRFPVTAEMVKPGSRLKLVQALSAGTDYLPVNALADRGVVVAGNHGSNAIPVAEYAVMLIIAANRQLARQVRQVNSGEYNQGFFESWEQFHEIAGKRVGIIGLGQIGSRVAKRLAGWECEIVYHDIAEIDPKVEEATGAKRVSLEELLRTSDSVTLHVPLDVSTRGMISDDEFSLMKPTACIVNTCRGPVIDEAALIRALRAGAIAGAGLDVTEIEPIEPDNPLLSMDNVFMGPHLAGLSVEARERALDFALHNASRLAAGLAPEGIVAPVR
ncbi:MAG: NAD(P)-dependent oxidoreductase [Dehalococcoidia bacterium]